MHSTPPLRVLIAEDGAADRLLLAQIVRRHGYEVLTAEDGAQAVALFAAERPDLVLLDALMPVMDGFEAARQIKAMAGEALVPIIFLTSLHEDQALAHCLEAGGDDFLAKPYSAVILGAKIHAMDRLRRLQATVLEQRDQIARHHHHLLSEQRVAKAVFDKVAHAGCLGAADIHYRQSPYALFNGDLLLAAYTPAGDMRVLLGDFTGHGLPAAIGAMPLADAFYGMTAKGHGLGDTLREINAKLKRVLPTDMFCCATLLSLDVQHGRLEWWSGGMPDAYRLSSAGELLGTLSSRHLPLGILASARFDARTEVLPMAPGERILLLSDGVEESADARGQLFGVQRLRQVLASNHAPAALFDELMAAVETFGAAVRDDISLCDVRMPPAPRLQAPTPVPDGSTWHPALDWSLSFELRGETLQRLNPVPHVLHLLQHVEGLRPLTGVLHTVIGELYSNALDHGVLGLDSRLKQDAAGFAAYYDARHAALGRLQDGWIRVRLEVRPRASGGCLAVEVEDSGLGFDTTRLKADVSGQSKLCGRGLALVKRLCTEAHWLDGGCRARVSLAF